MVMSENVPQVLLVEDELLIRDLLQGALEEAGFEVAYAESAMPPSISCSARPANSWVS
jgi:two-component system, cell cycle response regulator CpdR